MTIFQFLEKFAQCVHHDVTLNDLLQNQPQEIKTVYQQNKQDLLKKYLGEKEYTATPQEVVQIKIKS